MANDPKYVRLSDRASSGTLVDTYSHWGISGLDVVEFPADGSEAAQAFVRGALRSGLLESASRAEYDEVQNANEAVASQVYMDDETRRQVENAGQEAKVVRTALKEGQRLAAARMQEGGAAYEADQRRREAVLAVQRELDDEEIAVVGPDGSLGRAALGFGDDNTLNTAIHSEQGGVSVIAPETGRVDEGFGAGTGVGSLTDQIPQTQEPVPSEAPKQAAKRARKERQQEAKEGE